MTLTMISTLDQLTTGALQTFDLDPYGELNLTHAQREAMNDEGAALMITHAEEILQAAFPEAGITINGIGEICADIDADIDEAAWEDAIDEIKLGPDYDHIIDRYMGISDDNDDAGIDVEAEDDAAAEAALTDQERFNRWAERNTYKPFLTSAQFQEITLADPERALFLTGQIEGVAAEDARLAYLEHANSKNLVWLAFQAMDDAAAGVEQFSTPELTAKRQEKARRQELKDLFLMTHGQLQPKAEQWRDAKAKKSELEARQACLLAELEKAEQQLANLDEELTGIF